MACMPNLVNENELTAEMRDSASYLARQSGVSRVEAWPEPDGTMGLTYTVDGLTMTGFFDDDGAIVGDWLC